MQLHGFAAAFGSVRPDDVPQRLINHVGVDKMSTTMVSYLMQLANKI